MSLSWGQSPNPLIQTSRVLSLTLEYRLLFTQYSSSRDAYQHCCVDTELTHALGTGLNFLTWKKKQGGQQSTEEKWWRSTKSNELLSTLNSFFSFVFSRLGYPKWFQRPHWLDLCDLWLLCDEKQKGPLLHTKRKCLFEPKMYIFQLTDSRIDSCSEDRYQICKCWTGSMTSFTDVSQAVWAPVPSGECMWGSCWMMCRTPKFEGLFLILCMSLTHHFVTVSSLDFNNL